jgi:hypothetical protein
MILEGMTCFYPIAGIAWRQQKAQQAGKTGHAGHDQRKWVDVFAA